MFFHIPFFRQDKGVVYIFFKANILRVQKVKQCPKVAGFLLVEVRCSQTHCAGSHLSTASPASFHSCFLEASQKPPTERRGREATEHSKTQAALAQDSAVKWDTRT